MAAGPEGFKYYLETVNNVNADQPMDLTAYLFDSGLIARGRPCLGVSVEHSKGKQALWVTMGEKDEFVCVAPARVEGDEIVWDRDDLITPFRGSTKERLAPFINQVPTRIPLLDVIIPEPRDHPDKI